MSQTDRMIEILQDSMVSLSRSGILDKGLSLDRETILLGDGSPLDSMGFVTFVSDVEERLNRETGEDVYIVLTELEEMYPGSVSLSAAMFADFLEKLIAH